MDLQEKEAYSREVVAFSKEVVAFSKVVVAFSKEEVAAVFVFAVEVVFIEKMNYTFKIIFDEGFGLTIFATTLLMI